MDVTNLKTITFDSAKYKLVPVDPSTQMLDGGFDGINLSWDAMLAEVPDQLPGVVVHSGEPVAWTHPRFLHPKTKCIGIGATRYQTSSEQRPLYTHPWVNPAPSQPSAEALVQAALEAAEVLSAQNLRTDIVDRIEDAICALSAQQIIEEVTNGTR